MLLFGIWPPNVTALGHGFSAHLLRSSGSRQGSWPLFCVASFAERGCAKVWLATLPLLYLISNPSMATDGDGSTVACCDCATRAWPSCVNVRVHRAMTVDGRAWSMETNSQLGTILYALDLALQSDLVVTQHGPSHQNKTSREA